MNVDLGQTLIARKAMLGVATCVFLSVGAGTLRAGTTPGLSGTISAMTTQQKTTSVKGKIVDANGDPIIGASVLVKGTTNGVITDIDGNYSLSNVANGSTLVCSYIGYKTIEVKASDAKGGMLNLTMKEDTEVLDEVIVVGYGTQKKATLTGSVSQLGGEELKKTATVNLTSSLAGKTAGVIANNRSGEPGSDDAKILIRGKGTFGDTGPLIVVDGIADRSFGRLNPEDIESISVLKDAAAAIYGARAANGVILVTTKRGKDGKMSINYSGNYSVSQPTRLPKMLNAYQYATYINEYDADKRHGQAGLTYSEEALKHYQDRDDQLNYPDTNWWEALCKDWVGKTQHSLSLSGGTDRLSFYASAQYLWQDAMYKNSAQDYNQYQFIANVDAKVNKAVKLSLDILGRKESRSHSNTETKDLMMWENAPNTAPYFPNGLLRAGNTSVGNNPAIKTTDVPGFKNHDYSLLNLKPKLRIDLDIIAKGLYVEGYAALDFTFRNGKTMNRPFDIYTYNKDTKEYINRKDATGKIYVFSWSDYSTKTTLNGRIGYSRTFNEVHKVDAFAAYEQYQYKYSELEASRTNFLSTALPELFAGSSVPEDKDNNGYSDASARCNFFGRVNYGYKDKYLAEVTMRYDGSMNFAQGKRWGLFPAAAIGWVVSEEAFFEPLKEVLSFFKLKASWGQMGNDNIAAYQYLSQYEFTSDGAYFGTGDDGMINKGLKSIRTANPVVTWETATTANVGFSSQFLDGKFGLDFDLFKSSRKDILLNRSGSVPAYSGLTLPAENLAKVNNKGIEMVATYRDRAGDFEWGVSGNFTFARNKIIYRDEAASVPEWQRSTGHPIDGLVIYEAIGIYQTQKEIDDTPHIADAKPGDLIYRDVNGDKKITKDDAIRIDETATPQIMYGFTLNGGWKGLDINIFFQGQAKAQQLVKPGINMATEFFEGRWRTDVTPEENAAARWPKAFTKGYADKWNGDDSSWWLRSAAFLRLKSLEVGYTMPKALIDPIGVERLRLYINGNNLFSIDKMKIADPELTDPMKSYPLQRMITIGANVTF